jgi:hypothetical protein
MNSDVTQLLNALYQGDPHAASRLLPVVYGELLIERNSSTEQSTIR